MNRTPIRHTAAALPRCAWLVLALLLAGCATGLPPKQHSGISAEAMSLLEASAQAHGKDAFSRLRDINVSYDGRWYALVTRIQAVLTDKEFRVSSEERILLAGNRVGQAHRGPGGRKQVAREADSVTVWYNGSADSDPERNAAAALVADGYRMFLLGPLFFLSGTADLELAGTDTVEGRRCDLLLATRRPGHGLSQEDRYLLFIDREDRLLRRIRFSMEGLESTRGAVVEVDFFDHVSVGGVRWPTRYFERIRKPIPLLPVHRWQLTGIDLNRGWNATDIAGPTFTGAAAAPAQPLP